MRRHKTRRDRTRRPERGTGFTMVEMLVVLVVISILVAFILRAAMGSIRRAEERATQALITKLETGITDRLETLASQRADANNAHAYLAAIWTNALPAGFLAQNNRAQTIAQIDMLKAEVPDVFVVQNAPGGLPRPFDYYPLNFAAAPYGGTASPSLLPAMQPHAAFFLPLGSGIWDSYSNNTPGSPGADRGVVGTPPVSTGIYGASYTAAAGLYKQLAAAAAADGQTLATPIVGNTPASRGYDGVDNDGNGLIDELSEHGSPAFCQLMVARLAKHTHKTARAEVLYALLVEGQGPFGSVFSRDEFRDTEVKDTDGDGLLEFVDAWGEPLQFYRWPMFYTSDVQLGAARYTNGIFQTREQNPLDSNQQLMSPAWWSNTANNASSTAPWNNQAPLSGPAAAFQGLFFALTDPNADPALTQAAGTVWDRSPDTASPYYARRAYYSRFLVISGGPDKAPGVPVLEASYFNAINGYDPSVGTTATLTAAQTIATSGVTLPLLLAENQAAQATPWRNNTIYYSASPTDPLSAAIAEAGNDDITSHNLQAAGGATQ